ncbi:MAG TPA: hypothetical protein VLD61_11035 [Methylomirabilota bacterium]|nr:hypothetical protein [Methylomirabilota bacterium]
MTSRPPVSSRRLRAVGLVALPLLVVLAYFVGIRLGGAAFKSAVLSEDGPIELSTAALYLASAGIIGALAWITRGMVPLPYRTLYALLALGAVFVALEEVSYGQHLFGWSSPPWFASHNVKGEVNLHNLYGDRPTRLLRNLALVGYGAVGIALPGLARLRYRVYPPGHWTYYLLPRGEIVILVALAILLRRLRKLPSSAFTGLDLGLDELMELCLAGAALVYVLVLWRRLARERAGTRPP